MSQLDLLAVDTNPSSDNVSLPPKASGAYKTISAVSEELDVPQHVLRFWEDNFPQVKPSRMRGARRYYRPEDVDALKTIKALLYNKGYTIKGAKKALRKGMSAEMPVARATAHPSKASLTGPPAKKDFDRKSLVSELRVVKSMLTALL